MKALNSIIHSFIILFALITTFSFSQHLDFRHSTIAEMREILETASRSGQEVWAEDFTGLE
jgi:hypothetical protein